MPEGGPGDRPRGPLTLGVGLAQIQDRGDDRALVAEDLGLFAVFDGLGGIPGSHRAAARAALTVERICRGEGTPQALLVAACLQANQEIIAEGLGATTACLAWVRDRRVQYLSIGDSRIYLLAASGELRQLTQDQGTGNVVDNVLGYWPQDRQSLTSQQGSFELGSGDRLALVTDGVTGDFPPDVLSSEELRSALLEGGAERAARRLVEVARKADDRIALVVALG